MLCQESVEPLDCPTHGTVLSYCPKCIRLLCEICNPEHAHATKRVRDIFPKEIKARILERQKQLRDLAPTLQETERSISKARELPLYFIEKGTKTEVDAELFTELGRKMDSIQQHSLQIKAKTDKCSATIDSYRMETKCISRVLADFDSAIKNPQKFVQLIKATETYKNSKDGDAFSKDRLKEDLKFLQAQQAACQEDVGDIMATLQQHWFEGIPQKILALKGCGPEMEEKVRRLVKMHEQQQTFSLCLGEQLEILNAISRETTDVSLRSESIIKALREKEVGKLLDEVENARIKFAALKEKNAFLVEINDRVNKKNRELLDLREQLEQQVEAKNQALLEINKELEIKQKALREILGNVDMAYQKLDGMLTCIDSQTKENIQKYQYVERSLADVEEKCVDIRTKVDEADQVVQEKKEELAGMQALDKSLRAKLSQNFVAFERQKLAVGEYVKQITMETTKSAEKVQTAEKRIEALDGRKHRLGEWLKEYVTKKNAAMAEMEKAKAELAMGQKKLEEKQTEMSKITAVHTRYAKSLLKLKPLHEKLSAELKQENQRYRALKTNYDALFQKVESGVKELSGLIVRIRDNFERNKCGLCTRVTKRNLLLECRHPLCEQCVEAGRKNELPLKCVICMKTSNRVMKMLHKDCAVEAGEFDDFVAMTKLKTRGHFRYYDSCELTILPVRCCNGHELTEVDLKQLFPADNIDLAAQDKFLNLLKDADKANPRRERILHDIHEKMGTTDFSTSVMLEDDGVRLLADSLSSMKSLEKLDLEANKIGNPGIEYLAVSLMVTAPRLQVLDLRRNLIGDEGMKSLSVALRSMKVLRELNLSFNKLGPVSGSCLASVINYMSQLKVLCLTQIGLGPVGTESLAKALTSNESIETLYLNKNLVGDAGAIALGKALGKNTGLKTIEINSNVIGPRGMRALVDGLIKNKGGIVQLDAKYNKANEQAEEGVFSKEVCEELVKAKDGKLKFSYS